MNHEDRAAARRHAGRCALVALGLAVAAPAKAHDEDVQFWFGQSVSHRIDKATVISTEISQRAREAGVGGDQLLGRVTLTRRIAPGVEVALGVASATNAGIGELRPEQAIILTQGVLSLRSRLEERMIDGAETVVRLRERLMLAVPLDREARWTFLMSGEGFFQLNRTRPNDVVGLNTVRTQIGVRHALTPALSATLLYQRQQAIRPGRADTVAQIPVLALGWAF